MRRLFFLVYCLLAGGFLAAQTLEARIIYVPPVRGEGAGSSDAEWFTGMAEMEIPVRGFTLGERAEDSQYTLDGSLSPYPGGRGERLFALHLALINNKTGSPMVEQDLIYASRQEAAEWYSVILFSMLANIPLPGVIMPESGEFASADPDPTDPSAVSPINSSAKNRTWQDKWLYVGAALEWDHRRYIHGDASSFKDGIGGRVFAELQFLNFMSLEAGAQAARDEPRYNGEAFKVYSLEGYAALTGVIKVLANCVFEPYAGVSVNFPFSTEIDIPSLSWLAGLQLGVKVGPGCVFTDVSYSQDFAQAAIKDIDFSFDRQMINVGLGYKIGFFDRKR
jgi:hypothetical protein